MEITSDVRPSPLTPVWNPSAEEITQLRRELSVLYEDYIALTLDLDTPSKDRLELKARRNAIISRVRRLREEMTACWEE
jgi:hypothetical protein